MNCFECKTPCEYSNPLGQCVKELPHGTFEKGYQPSGVQDPLRCAAAALVEAVEQYVEPKPGTPYMHRTKILAIKNKLKEML